MDDDDFTDQLSDYIRRIEEVETPEILAKPIITSDDLEICLPKKLRCHNGVNREQIGWRLYRHPMYYIVSVDAGAIVPFHSHEEDVFRYIISGSLDIQVKESEKERSPKISRTVHAGQWFVVRANRPYRIEAGTGKGGHKEKKKKKPHGYVALVAYQMKCTQK